VNITVVAPPPLVLQASTVRVEKKDAVELAWNGALGTSVRVYRNGVLVATRRARFYIPRRFAPPPSKGDIGVPLRRLALLFNRCSPSPR
jgi:hypothetical protein